jgi:hypothetical protein
MCRGNTINEIIQDNPLNVKNEILYVWSPWQKYHSLLLSASQIIFLFKNNTNDPWLSKVGVGELPQKYTQNKEDRCFHFYYVLSMEMGHVANQRLRSRSLKHSEMSGHTAGCSTQNRERIFAGFCTWETFGKSAMKTVVLKEKLSLTPI